MRISRNYKPWLLVPGDDSRPVIECALVERIDETRGRLVVANGFAMGFFDVALEPDEQVGLVKAKHLKYARSVMPRDRRDNAYAIYIADDMVTMPDGSRHPQQQRLNYPAWRHIMPTAEEIEATEPRSKMGLTPDLLESITAAFGFREHVVIRLTGTKAGILIITDSGHPRTARQWANIEPPFALLMPCHIQDDPAPMEMSRNGNEKAAEGVPVGVGAEV